MVQILKLYGELQQRELLPTCTAFPFNFILPFTGNRAKHRKPIALQMYFIFCISYANDQTYRNFNLNIPGGRD
jgi:hypothetical protein